MYADLGPSSSFLAPPTVDSITRDMHIVVSLGYRLSHWFMTETAQVMTRIAVPFGGLLLKTDTVHYTLGWVFVLVPFFFDQAFESRVYQQRHPTHSGT